MRCERDSQISVISFPSPLKPSAFKNSFLKKDLVGVATRQSKEGKARQDNDGRYGCTTVLTTKTLGKRFDCIKALKQSQDKTEALDDKSSSVKELTMTTDN
jgi:hypothetical protein